ncbi:MAG: zinc ABC transporter substrate-binding protein [Candidatus Izemoplasmatales bacterium]
MKKTFLLLFILILSFMIVGCQNTTQQNSRLNIAVTIVPEEAFVKNIGGEYINVLTIIPPGYSPANHEPSAKMMAELSDVDAYFAIGVPAEEGNIFPKVSELNLIKLHEEVAKVYPDREFAPGNRDPHIWLSIKRVKVMIEVIATELSRLDPEMETFYWQNAHSYLEELDVLNQKIIDEFASVEHNMFMVFHPSFGYFADDYGLVMNALELDGKEATINHLQDMIDLAKANDIHKVFYQAEINSEQVESFIEEIDGELVRIDPLSSDYIDNLYKISIEIGDSLS